MTQWERRSSGMSLKTEKVSQLAAKLAADARDISTDIAIKIEHILQRTPHGRTAVRSASVSSMAIAGGAVFGIGLLAAMAPLDADSAPRLADTRDGTSVLHVASIAPAPAAQAALLPLQMTPSAAAAAAAAPATPQADSPAPTVTSGLRGSIAVDPVSDINAAFDAETLNTPDTELTAEHLGPPAPILQTVSLEIESGDTIGGVLADLGIPPEDARAAANALAEHFSPRDLRIGQELEVELETTPVEVASIDEEDLGAPATSLVSFSLKADSERSLRVSYNAENSAFESQEIFRELTKRLVRAEGTIEGSLFGSASKLGVPNSIMVSFMKLYSYSVDFQREIRKGDTFEVYYTEFADEDGERVKSGDILFASLQTGKKPLALWRFEVPGEGVVDYFNEDGQSSKKFLMRTPIDGARISSGFGNRRHPILGYNKMHTGTDFAAPTGTPIYAAGNGTIVKAGWNGGFGKYVKIRHANGYETAYAHMSRISKGITPGARVTQGQTIGRVGSTGRSTGPHLHYEVHVRGKKVNPMAIRVPTGRKLEGKALSAFKASRDGMNAEMAQVEPLQPQVNTASAKTPNTDNSVE